MKKKKKICTDCYTMNLSKNTSSFSPRVRNTANPDARLGPRQWITEHPVSCSVFLDNRVITELMINEYPYNFPFTILFTFRKFFPATLNDLWLIYNR